MLRNTGFFIGAWACHYLPFYLMSRQLFLHHYLPAHLASALVAGSVLNFAITEEVNYPVSKAGLKTRLRPVVRAQPSRAGTAVTAGLVVIMMITFWFLSPFTYGTPSSVPVSGRWGSSMSDLNVAFSLQFDWRTSEREKALEQLDITFRRGESQPPFVRGLWSCS